jgi:DNA end-binding protein Ku
VPRNLWGGSLSFGLINVPIRLVSATRDLDIRFRQLHETDNVPIEQRRYCKEEGVEVSYEEIGHGYELDEGEQVVLTSEELTAAEPRKTRTIDIEQFVDLDDVDPIYFDHPYFLLPAGESEGTARAYRLLVDAMRQKGRAALGRFVLRNKEHLVLIRERDERLGLTTLLFHDEVRSPGDVETGSAKKPPKAQVTQAVELIEAMTVEWDPANYKDCYRSRLEHVIEQKKQGERVKAPSASPAESEATPVADLMAALQQSLASREGGPSRRDGSRSRRSGAEDLAGLSREELYERAQSEGVPGRSKMSKGDLIGALEGTDPVP